jgi:hypothetical protein
MAANSSITSGQSIALPEVVVHAPSRSGSSGAGSNPSEVIGPIGGGPTQLIYPADRPKYFMKFDIHEYSRANLIEVGKLGPVLSSIVLPMASNLTDVTSARWDDNFEVGQLTGAAIDNLAIPTINSFINGSPASDAVSGLGSH